MPQPVIAKSPFCDGYCDLYIPADFEGKYWTVYTLGWPYGVNTYEPYLAILQAVYGIVRPGKYFVGYGGAWGDETGVWADTTTSGDASWWYRHCSENGAYVDIAIPAGYNEIHLTIYDVAGDSSFSIAWDDASTTGLDITSYDSSETKVKTLVIAANANPDGIKKLRITQTSTTKMRYIGVRCWDTDAIGDPSTETAGGSKLALGHSLCVQKGDFLAGSSASGIKRNKSLNDTSAVSLTKDTALLNMEYAFCWDKSGGGGAEFTGGNIHLIAAGNHEYVMDAAYITDDVGPELIIDGTSKGNIWKLADVPRNTVLTGDLITLFHTGYANEETLSPDMECKMAADCAGLSIMETVEWDGDIVFDATPRIYGPMLYLDALLVISGSYIKRPPNSTEHSIYGLGGSIYLDRSSTAEVYLAGLDIVIRMVNFMPSYKWYFDNPAKKLYSWADWTAMAGGATPASGDVWNFGGRFEIRKRTDIQAPANKMGGVIR